MDSETQKLEDEVTAALSIEDEQSRVQRLLELAPSLPANLVDRILVATNQLQDISLRSYAIGALGPYLSPEQVDKAVTFASRISNLSERNSTFGSLAPYVSEETRASLIDTIKTTPTPEDRLRGWIGLAPYLPSELKQEAISTALALTDEFQRSNALTALAPHLPEVWRLKAWESVRTISYGSTKVRALAGIIPALPKREQATALNEALELARVLPAGEKAEALLELLPLIPIDLKEDFFKETHRAILEIEDLSIRVNTAIRLADTLPLKQALGYLRSTVLNLEIENDRLRGDILIDLAQKGPSDLRSEILDAARKIKDPQIKSNVIIQLSGIIEQETTETVPSEETERPADFEEGPNLPPSSDAAEQQQPIVESPSAAVVDTTDQSNEPPTESAVVADLPPTSTKTAKAPRQKPVETRTPTPEEIHEPAEPESVNTKTYLHSDRWTLDDQLNYSIYASAIAQFILHPDTKPPLAIGILAPWGQGKTTLMKLIQKELQVKSKEQKGTSEGNVIKPGLTSEPVSTTTGVVAPPLTTSLTFSYLRKWLQDPHYEKLTALEYPTVWFNAWKYQNTEQLWAGMAYSILSQLVAQIGTQADQEKFWLALQAERVDFNAIRQDIHRMIFERVAPWIGISMVFAVFGVVLIVISYFVGDVLSRAGGGVIMLASVVFPIVKWFLDKAKINSKPLEGKFAQYVRQPTYEGKLGFFHEIETDVQRVFKLLIAPGKPAIVFIDDLDRCSPGTVAQVIEAMNLFLSADFPDCYFVVGMDAQVVAASMEVAYENLDKKMHSVTRSYGSLGWYFMDKFIQLQFSIPNMTPDQRGIYLTRLFGQEVGKKEAIPEAELDKIEKQIEETLNRPEIKAEQLSQQAAEIAKFRLQRPKVHQRLSNKVVTVSAQKLSDDNPSLQKQIERYEPYLGVSPRGIKRFSNLYRFYNLSQITRRTQGLPSCSQSALARWLVIMLRWPQLVRWIQWEGEAKFNAGASALKKAEVFEEELVSTEDHSAWLEYLNDLDPNYADWMGDKQLYEFLKSTARPTEKLSLAVQTGVW